jgi:SAM-dependent methyltransferase
MAEMEVSSRIVPKSYIRIPSMPRLSVIRNLWRAAEGSVLSPIYWILAHRYGVPGLRFRLDSALLGLRILCSRRATISYSNIFSLIMWPMVSVRYFEFDFMRRTSSTIVFRSYLDISSPRLFPVLIAVKNHDIVATLLNPDVGDLALTRQLVRAAGIENRCRLHSDLISSAPFEDASFDIITSISVLEHIPDDTQAVQRMWDLLKPQGRLLLTVPCAAGYSEEYLDRNEYGLSNPGEDGFFFFQRYYDQKVLQERIFRITGQPCRYAVYGEMKPGLYRKNMEARASNPNYPAWREPYMMGKEYGYFEEINDLPGVGVIGMEFVKP